MGVFEQFPYANMHEMNLNWLLMKMKDLYQAMDTFKATESLKFADPIIWDITTQYEKSTIVLDTTGNAYLSLQAVPAGVQLNNEEYWLEIFNFTDYTRTANRNLTVNVETNTTRATAAYQVDDWLIWEDVLYRVTSAIYIDDALIVSPTAGFNLIHFTVEDFIKAFINYATGLINQYKNDIDISEAAYRQQLANDIASTTSSLQAQLNAAIAGVTVDSEVINARVGADGITYPTLGDAIRSNDELLKNYIGNIENETLYPFVYDSVNSKIDHYGKAFTDGSSIGENLYTDGSFDYSTYGTRVLYSRLTTVAGENTVYGILPVYTRDSSEDLTAVHVEVYIKTTADGATTRRFRLDSGEHVTIAFTENEKYIEIVFYHASTRVAHFESMEVVRVYEEVPAITLPEYINIPSNKKIVWFGTSIPAGNAIAGNYPEVIAEKLGVTVYNEAVGESSAKAGNADYMNNDPNSINKYDTVYETCVRRMGRTLSEQQYFIDNYDFFKSTSISGYPETLSADEKKKILNYSYERKLYRYLTNLQSDYSGDTGTFVGDVDLYVFDHGYNDRPDLPSFTVDPGVNSLMRRFYFMSVMQMYFKIILSNNPSAKIAVITHYRNQGVNMDILCNTQINVGESWDVPVCKVFEKIGWTNNEVSINGNNINYYRYWCPDGTHPHSKSDGSSIERYAEVLAPFIRDLLI